MNSYFKIIITVFCVIVIGIGFYFLKSKQVSNIITETPHQKKSGTEVKSEVKGPVKRKGYWSTEYTDKPIWMEKDPFEKSPAEAAFDKKLKAYQNKEFFIIPAGSEQAQKSKILQSKNFWIANYIINNESWYKSDYHDDLSDSKVTIFFNFYNCSITDPKTNEPVRCFKIFMYNFRNDNWHTTSEVARQTDIRWKNNTAYAQIRLEHLGDFTRHTGTWFLMIPIPRDSMPIYYIKYEDNKFSLEKGPDSDWVLVTEKEVEKFQRWAQSYKVKHGETPGP